MASFREFALKVMVLENEINSLVLQQGSKEWYLKSKLSQLARRCSIADSAKDVTAEVQALMRFAVDSLDFNSKYATQIEVLATYHDSLLRADVKNAS